MGNGVFVDVRFPMDGLKRGGASALGGNRLSRLKEVPKLSRVNYVISQYIELGWMAVTNIKVKLDKNPCQPTRMF